MTIKKGAIAIDTKMNYEKIEGEFKNLEKETSKLIDKYNRGCDSIKSQELAIQKVKDQIETLQGYKDVGLLKDNEAQRLNELTAKLPLLQSKLSQTKEETNEVKDSIKEAFKQQHLKGFNSGIDNIGKKIDKFKNKVTRLIGTAMVFSLLRNSLNNLKNGFVSLLKSNDTFNGSLNQIKANLMTAFAPIYNACLPAINSLMNALSKITGTIAVFISGLFGKSLKDAQKDAKGLSKALDKAGKSGEKASGSLASFDKLEVVQDNSSSGGSNSTGIDYNSEIQYSQSILDFLNKIKEFIDNNRELVLGVISGIAMGIMAIKLGCDGIGALGIGVFMAGIVMLLQDFVNFLNDPSWSNFANILTDISIIIGGLMLVSGNWFGLLVAGVAMVVKLIISNWETVKNAFGSGIQWIKNKFSTLVNFFNSIISKIVTAFRNLGTKVGNAIGTAFRMVINGILSAIENILNFPIKSVNKLLDIINAVPGINIKKLNTFNLPRLATGAVLPPRQEFAAILGDQKHGTNIETPASLMADIFDERLNKFFSKFENLSNDVKEIVFRNLTIVAQFGNRDFQKLVIDAVRLTEKEMGKPLFVS